MAADPPEIPTTEKWRADMVVARRKRGLSQERLGAMVGASQNVISLIESGGVKGSEFVLPISKKLRIPPPFFGDEDQQTWLDIGVSLSSRNPALFRQAQALIETMLQSQPEDEDEAETESTPVRPPVK